MSFLAKILIHVLSNGAAIYIASNLIEGITFQANLKNFLIAGLVLGFVNAIIRPLVKIISFPLVLLTLGLFTAIINIALLFLVDTLLPSLTINGFLAAFWGVIIISLVNYLISNLIND